MMIVEVTKDVRKSGVKELLYADDLVQLGDIWEEAEKRCAQWKKAVTEKGLKLNLKKKKVFALVRELSSLKQAQFVEVELEVTPFYASNVTVGCIKNAPEYKSASAVQYIL